MGSVSVKPKPISKCTAIFTSSIAYSVYSGIAFAFSNLFLGKLSNGGAIGITYMWTGALAFAIPYFIVRCAKIKIATGKCFSDLYIYKKAKLQRTVLALIAIVTIMNFGLEASILWNFQLAIQ